MTDNLDTTAIEARVERVPLFVGVGETRPGVRMMAVDFDALISKVRAGPASACARRRGEAQPRKLPMLNAIEKAKSAAQAPGPNPSEMAAGVIHEPGTEAPLAIPQFMDASARTPNS